MSSSPYQPAATLLNKIWERHVGLKSLAFDRDGQLTCSKTTYAQVCQVQRYRSSLDSILQVVTGVSTAKNQGLLYVLLYELLLGPNKSIRGGGALKRSLMKHEAALREALTDIQEKETQTEEDQGRDAAARFPRYVRVNTCRTTTQNVVRRIRKSLLADEGNGEIPFLMYADRHVPDLLVLPSGSTERLKQLEEAWSKEQGGSDKNGNLMVLQDKSSCFSALCLHQGFDSDITLNEKKEQRKVDWIDACAAPGNKTSHLAALLMKGVPGSKSSNIEGTLYAFDRDKKRQELLQRRLEQFVPKSKHLKVLAKEQDFLETKPSDYSHVRGILLDPTCSGSGIFTSLDERQHQKDDEKRLASLSNFQVKALEHACSFPSVERIVYSTCSVRVEENERAVARLLKDKREEWQVVAPTCLAHWTRRGVDCTEDKNDDDEENFVWSKEEAACMIRAHYEDETNGFFVCCLERRNVKKSKKKSKPADGELHKLAEKLELEVYNGQFASSQSDDKKREKKRKIPRVDSDDVVTAKSSSEESPKKKPKRNKRSTDAASDGEKTITTAVTAVSKKIAKKLEWKKRQRQQKLDRVGEGDKEAK
jgi:putative methyltransferase